MCYTLKEIFKQAKADEFSAVLDGEEFEARILSGIRIEQNINTADTIIHNTTIGGDFYKEITDDEYEVFYQKGWRYAVFVLSLSNYRRKLKMIEEEWVNNNLQLSEKQINQIMNRMPEKCDPFIYYNRVRPYIFGWKNNPATPNGVIYEDVQEYGGTPQLFRGETGAQSSIVPALDALLGITHSNDPLKEYLDEMRLYMPKEHRNLLNDLDEWSENNRGNFTRQDNLVQLSEEIIREVHAFRDKHLEYARIYIYEQSLSNQNNSNVVGTGGTPFMKYLDKHLQETVKSID